MTILQIFWLSETSILKVTLYLWAENEQTWSGATDRAMSKVTCLWEKTHLKQDFRLIGQELARKKPTFYLGDNIQNGGLPKNKWFHNSLE